MQSSEHRSIKRLRELAAVALMLVAMPLVASCGGGGEEGNGGGNNGGGQDGGQAGGGGGKPGGGTGGDAPPITDVRVIISSPDPQTLDKNRARLNGVEVREMVSDRAFYVGENDAERLLVVNVGDPVEVSEGQSVVVAGRLRTPQPELEKQLSLNPEEAAALKEQDILLRAPQVVVREG